MRKRKERLNNLLTLPITLWAFAFMGLSLLYIIAISFLTSNGAMGVTKPFTTQNYVDLLNPVNFKVLVSSLKQAVLTTLFCLVIGYPFGYFMAKIKPRMRLFLMVLLMAPFWTSALIRIYGWRILLMADGPLNTLLLNIGIIQEPLKMLYKEGTVLMGMVYALLPFMILPSYTAVEKMDWSTVEASRDLGASPFKAFLTVTVPLTKSGILAGILLVFIPAIGLFFINDLLGGGKMSSVGNLMKDVQKTRNLPLMAALSVVLLFIIGILLKVYQKLGGKTSDLNVL